MMKVLVEISLTVLEILIKQYKVNNISRTELKKNAELKIIFLLGSISEMKSEEQEKAKILIAEYHKIIGLDN